MNCPTRVDPEALPNGWNQNPDTFATQTNRDTDATANRLRLRDHRIDPTTTSLEGGVSPAVDVKPAIGGERKGGDVGEGSGVGAGVTGAAKPGMSVDIGYSESDVDCVSSPCDGCDAGRGSQRSGHAFAHAKAVVGPRLTRHSKRAISAMDDTAQGVWGVLKKYAKFVGPGWMISVAYIDPGNYATDVAAGASYRYKLLVMILVSNLIAIFLQSLCVKLGSVTGLNLAEMCKKHFPPWLNIFFFVFAEAGIIATDMAEVIGTAVALNLLGNIPLVWGCVISIADVLFILIFYRPGGSMRWNRIFEAFVALLVLGVVICFAIELSLVDVGSLRELFRGYAPSSALIQRDGIYQATGILGATVMPHSLYLGSGLVQPRLRDFDETHNNVSQPDASSTDDTSSTDEKYRPSLAAIRYCLKYSIVDLGISLFTFALFVNSAILIVAGASLYNKSGDAADASLFAIYHLLSDNIGKAAGIIFALALLLSGISAGIVCTIAGQMVWMGQINMPIKPWVQRLVTRSIAIVPSIVVAGAVGKDGISRALEGSQIALSVILPFVSAPLIWFTCRSQYMTVPVSDGAGTVNLRNNWLTATVAVVIWGLIVVMNVASWVLQGTG